MNANVNGAFYCVHAILPHMREHGILVLCIIFCSGLFCIVSVSVPVLFFALIFLDLHSDLQAAASF
jgi:hypothetical protein